MTWALIDFAAWCFDSGNLAGTITGKFAAVQYFHRMEAGVEVETSPPLIKCALRGIARSHAEAGTRHRVRLPVTLDMLLEGESLIPSWGVGGKVIWMCLTAMYFFLLRSDEMFASNKGVIHPAHCLTRRDVAFFFEDRQLEYMEWRQADAAEVRFRGHKADPFQLGSVRARTRDDVRGPQSGYRAGGGAVALMVELMSCHPTLPDHAPLSSYRSGRRVVNVFRYRKATEALRDVVEKSGRDPKDFALHSLRIGGPSALAAGGEVSDRVVQRAGRWKSDAYKRYVVNNLEDSRKVSRILGDRDKGVHRQPGEGTVWGCSRKRRRT